MSTTPFHQPPPDPQHRIEELEARVSELTHLVARLVEERDVDEGDDEYDTQDDGVSEAYDHRPGIFDGMRDNVRRVLGGVAGESLESRIGGIWLGRIAAVLTMTAIALGGAVTITDETLEAMPKVIIGYLIGFGMLLYGLLARRRQDLFAHTMLGCGLAVIYFTTYAAFFVSTMRLIPTDVQPVPFLAACLVLVGIVAHFKKSQAAAGITLFLLYYTIVLSVSEGTSIHDVRYGFVSVALISIMALVFHLTHRWLVFTWAALIGTHLTYIYFFWVRPPVAQMTPDEFFWFSNGLLTLTFVVFALACVTDARKTGEYRKTVAPMAGLNSSVFLVLTWFSIRQHYPEDEWAFRLGITALLVVFAMYAYFSGPRRNYLFQLFVAKAVVMFTLALQAYLSHEWLLIAMALECFGLGLSYKRSGAAIFKVLELLLVAITFGACLWAVRLDNVVELGRFTVPANWFCSVGVAIVFALTATLFEHFVHRPRPHERQVKAQWFLADTFLDVSMHTAALIHAAAAALIVLVVTIIDLGSEPILPFVLAAEALIFAVVGFSLRTGQLEVSSVLLLVASHVTYHMFARLDGETFRAQTSFGLFTTLVAGFTFFGGYLWERYLRRIKGDKRWDHAALACVPYVGAYLMLSAYLVRQVEFLYVPLLENAVILGLLLASAAAALPGLRLAGILALIMSTAQVVRGMQQNPEFVQHADFIWVLSALAGTYFIAERLVRYWRPEGVKRWTLADTVSWGLIAAMVLVGVFGLWRWAPDHRLTYYLLGFAVLTMIAGVGARSSGHRWAALAIYSIAIVRAYVYDLTNLNQLYRFASFLALCIPLLIISWAYSQYRLKNLRDLSQTQRSETAPSEH